tara:strand:+ start:54 stop:530 length:477 start_codon:yes stop_codon:yes gene_type:complete
MENIKYNKDGSIDKRRNNGGHKVKNAGRKKGVGLAVDIKNHCYNFMNELLKDEAIKKKAINQLAKSIEEQDEGYVYIINNSDYFKIGFTKNFKNRIQHYNTHYEKDVDLVYLFKHKDAYLIESDLHLIFKNKLHRGEWFKLSNEDLLKAISYCSNKLN